MDLVHCLFVDNRADVCLGREAVTDTQLRCPFGKLCYEFFVDLFVNHKSRRGGTSLAARSECSPQRALDSVVDVGVIHDNDGVLTAHLERYDLVITGTLLSDDLA